MGLTYKLGGGQGIIPGGPKKIKKAKQKSSEDVGREGRAKRMEKYDTPKEKEKVATAVKINTQTAKAKAEGLKFNEYGAPLGEQKHKKFNIFKRREKPKFDRNSK